MLSAMPRFANNEELERGFFASLARDEKYSFQKFCSSDDDSARIYRLIKFPPYCFAFLQKFRVGGNYVNIAFFAENISALYNLMSPSSGALCDIADALIRELAPPEAAQAEISRITPEILLSLTHISGFTSAVVPYTTRPVYCDMQKLVERVCDAFIERDIYSDVKFEFISRDPAIVELPRVALVYVLCSVFALLHVLSEDGCIRVCARKFAYAGEITAEATTSLCDKLPGVCADLSDLVCSFPSIAAVAQGATVIAHLSNLLLSVEIDREIGAVKITLGAGFDYQSEPDFKFSDPYSDIGDIVIKALDTLDTIK